MKITKFLFLLTFIFLNTVWAEKVLIIGDSHSCGDFGKQLVKIFSSRSHDVVMYCSPGLSVQHWINGFTPKNSSNKCKTFSSKNLNLVDCNGNGKTPPLKDVIAKENPTHIIPALGTNNIGLNEMDKFSVFAKQIEKNSLKCHWIGPPVLGPKGQICEKYGGNLAQLIKRIDSDVSGACQFIDSKEHTSTHNTADCIHRYGKAGRDWANCAAEEIRISPNDKLKDPNFVCEKRENDDENKTEEDNENEE